MIKAICLFSVLLFGLPSVSFSQTPPTLEELKSYTGFHAAAARGEVDAVARFVREGRGINGRDAYGRTPLMVAVYSKI
jgi:ankyrin repeat protein